MPILLSGTRVLFGERCLVRVGKAMGSTGLRPRSAGGLTMSSGTGSGAGSHYSLGGSGGHGQTQLRRLLHSQSPPSTPPSPPPSSLAALSSRIPPPRASLIPSFSSRPLTTTSYLLHGHISPPAPGSELHVTFIDKDGQKHTFTVSAGDNLLDIAQEYDLEMEGACGGSAACSTCHVIVADQAMYDKLPEPDDDENDMLDLAFGLTETSRLGCQVQMSKEVDGLVVKLPSMTRNLQSSDFSKK